jgi:hypothetical protein
MRVELLTGISVGPIAIRIGLALPLGVGMFQVPGLIEPVVQSGCLSLSGIRRREWRGEGITVVAGWGGLNCWVQLPG